MVFEKPQKCYFYRNFSCYLLYTTPAMGRILNILPAPLMEIWCGVIWVLIWINQIYAGPVGRHQARILQVILFSVFLPRSCAGAAEIQGHVGSSSVCAPSWDSASPQSCCSRGKCNGRVSPMGRCWACAGETGMPLSLFSVQ